MANSSIPPKTRPEWSKIISGDISHEFKNYVLQLSIYQMRKDISKGKITINRAVDDLYNLCNKYSLAVQSDLKAIFKTW